MKKAVLFLLLALIFSSCYDVTGPDQEKSLYGSWRLQKISGGLQGTTTEISPDKAPKVLFTYGGTVIFYSSDNKLARSTTFTLTEGKTIYSTDEKSIIHFADNLDNPMVIFSISEDTLVLADNDYDGFSYIYLKER
ncbi:MAG: hypothetical protein HF314_11210 [Ignavibacteria bacterium]|jgi:hypothetical protein|nr:hypothetical protein [Ignavibacteria bacterium]MCU7503636.1 hypothetical protein [Ignavibacteria bacterium]MCU7517881.1 hypothetical protein [Ignavibacteria bacterium]